ncbi:autotransporter domain-containing protein [Candidatus Odyssella acanthamoebae]|nr:autotransporter domain-containing protein [Candidatus Paracaedibacter acanthamoebae]
MKKSVSLSDSCRLSIISVTSISFMIMMISTPLLAGGTGGTGGAFFGSRGGTGGNGNDGTALSTAGTAGEDGSMAGAGGSAGAAGVGNGASGTNAGDANDATGAGGGGGGGNTTSGGSNINSSITGGAGGNGGSGGDGNSSPFNVGGGGGGGGGGDGVIVAVDTSISSIIIGGKGGDAGNPGDVLKPNAAGGAGGGGAGLILNASNGIITNTSAGSITGGSGGIGLRACGGGGAGVIFTANGTLSNNSGASITGGAGSVGGAGVTCLGSSVTINNEGIVNGGDALYRDSLAAIGGIGISISGNSTINNIGGTIRGGNSGKATYFFYSSGPAGGVGSGGALGSQSDTVVLSIAGAGIATTGDNVTVKTSGPILAGTGGENPANAIDFTGNNNTLELHNGFSFQGNVVCSSGTNNTLILGGTDPSTFDVIQLGNGGYQGFNSYQKKDTSTWTLLNSTATVTPWQLMEGTLEINNNQALGDAAGQFEFTGSGTGILKIGNDFTGAIANPINLQTDGFIDTQGKTVVLSGAITGTGALHKSGSGVLVLSGINTFTGGFLQNGTIALASNQGAGVGDIGFNAVGTVVKIAASLTGVANPIALATDGIIDTDGYNAVLTGPIIGGGKLTKNGEGTLELRYPSSIFSGDTSVTQGTLRVNGSLPNSAVTVGNGAMFTGNATIKSLTNNGTVKPGNSIGITEVSENYDNTNGVYACEINSANDSDLIIVHGAAMLRGTVYVIPQPGDYSTSLPYHILQSDNDLVGTFSSVSGSSPLLRYSLDHQRRDVYLRVRQVYFGNMITQGNPGIVAQYTDSLNVLLTGSMLERFENAIVALPTASVYDAFNQIHPAPNGLISSSLMANEFNQMDGILSFSFLDRNLRRIKKRIKASEAEANQLSVSLVQTNTGQQTRAKNRFGKTFRFSDLYNDGTSSNQSAPQNVCTTVGQTTLWLQQNGSHVAHKSNRDGSPTIGVAGIRAAVTDTSGGVDTLVSENLRMGATVGYGKTTYHLRQGYGKGRINSYHGGVYWVWEPADEDWYANASVFYGYHDFKGKRTLSLAGTKYTNRQTHHGYHLSGLTEIGRDFGVTKDITLTPYASFGWLYLKEDGYVEKEEGLNPSLTVHKHNNSFIQAKTGIQASQVFNVNGMYLYIYGKIGYTYKKYLHSSQGIKASFTGYAGNFQVFVHEKAQNMVNPGVGGSVLLANNISLAANYNAELSSKLQAHQATLNLTYRF